MVSEEGPRNRLSQINVLAVHSISHTTVSGNAVAEVLDIESSLETTGEEASKGCDEGGERSHNQGMNLERGIRDNGNASSDLRK